MKPKAVSFIVLSGWLLAGRDANAQINGTTWFPVGPAPVTQGQTYGGSRIDVAGRSGPIAINPANAQEIFLGTANGGVWHTTDGGQHWRPRSDDQGSLAIGAIVLDGCSATGCATIYVGTGENAIRRDTYRGAGLLIGTVTGGEFPTFTWTPSGVGEFSNGSINNIVLGASGHLFVTLSSGETASASESTVTAPLPPGGYGVYRSPDGSAWSKLTVDGSASAKPTSLVRDPQDANTLYAGFMGRGVFKTTDGGDHWCPLDPGIAVAGCSAVAGLPNPGTLTFDFVEIAIRRPSAAQPAVLYASFGVCGDPIVADCQPGIYRSNDGGASWTQQLAPIPGNSGIIGGCPRAYSRYTHVLKIDPDNADHLYLGGYALCRSDNGGQTFTTLGGLHPDQHDVGFEPGNAQHLYSSNDGGMYFSPDGGMTWLSRNDDLQITGLQSISSSPLTARVIIGTQDNGTQMWTGSRVWQHIDDGDSASTLMDLDSSSQMYDVYVRQCPRRGAGVLGSFGDIFTGLGVTSFQCYSSFVYPEDSAFYPPFSQDPQPPHALYIGTMKLYRSDNDGTQWNPVSPSLAGAGGPFPDIGTGNVISAIAVSGSNHNVVYVGMYDGSIWVSDAGTGPCTTMSCWHKVNSGTPAAPVSRIAVHPTQPGTAYAAFSGFTPGSHLFVTTNSGSSWTPAGPGLPADRPVNTISYETLHPERLWVGTDAGVFKSIDSGASFNVFSNGLPKAPVYEIALDETRGRAWAATHGRGVFVLTEPMLSNFEGWVNGGIWDIPVYGTGFLSNQTCTMQIIRQNGTVCASGTVDGDGGTIKTDDSGQLVTSKGAFYDGRAVAWGCLNGHCVGGGTVAACNQPGNPITSVTVTCGGQVGIEHVLECQQQDNPPQSVLGLDGTPTPGGGAPLGSPALPPGPQPPASPTGQPRAFYVVPTVQSGDGSTRALCSVRVPFRVGEDRGRVVERARDLVNASASCAASGVVAAATGIFQSPTAGGEDLPSYDPRLLLSARPVKGSQLMPAFQSDPGNTAGMCFNLQGLGVATTDQLEVTRVRFATGTGGARGGTLRLTETTGLGTCEIDVPTSPGQTATQVAASVAAAFSAPGIPGPFPACPSRHNPRDVVQDGDSVITVLPHALTLCVGDAGLGIAVQPDELTKRPPVANAGGDREVTGDRVRLDGSGSSDPDSTPGTADDIVLYEWTRRLPGGSVVPLGNGILLTTHLPRGPNHIQLKVTDKTGLSDTDTALIVVRKFAWFLDAGATIPHSVAATTLDSGLSINTGLEYYVTNQFSVEGILGFHHLDAKSGSASDEDLFQFSANAKRYFGPGLWRFVVNGGAGVYHVTAGVGTKAGINFGAGVEHPLTSLVLVEGVYNFHTVFTSGTATRFSTVQAGIRIRF